MGGDGVNGGGGEGYATAIHMLEWILYEYGVRFSRSLNITASVCLFQYKTF